MRIKNYPREYTEWWVEFYYQRFLINECVLIPRLETESLVRESVRFCRKNPPNILIDIGTGSGIIPLSILSAVDIPQTFAVDISSEALKVAKGNNKNQGKNIVFLESDLIGIFLEKESVFGKNANIVMTANLPYIKQDDWENMSTDTVHEPKLALFGWEHTGFELYEKFVDQIGGFVQKMRPKTLTLFVEIGEDQKEIAEEMLTEYGWKFFFFSDLRWIERFIKIEIV